MAKDRTVREARRPKKSGKKYAPPAKTLEDAVGPFERAQREAETNRWAALRRRFRNGALGAAVARAFRSDDEREFSIDIKSFDGDQDRFDRRRIMAGAHDVAARLMLAAAIDGSEGLASELRCGGPVVAFDVADPFELETVEACWQEVIFGEDAGKTASVGSKKTPYPRQDPRGFHLVVKELPKIAYGSTRQKEALAALAAARPIIALSPDAATHLPDALVRAGLTRLTLGPLAPRTIAETIRIVTGEKVRTVIEPEVAARTGLAEIGIAVRFDRSAAECVSRLRRLASAKVRDSDSRDLTLDQIHGLPKEAIEWTRGFVRDIESFRNGGPWLADAGVVWNGASGVGKTTLVRCLARETKCELLVTGHTRWQSHADGHLGHFLRLMTADFAEAKRRSEVASIRSGSGCVILFVDELDSFSDRASLTHSHRSYETATINGFIACCDGLGGADGNTGLADGRDYRKPRIVLMGATNDYRRCDPAVLRSGRFNRVITIPLPDTDALEAMMRVRLDRDLEDEDLTDLALMAAGFTGADIERVVNDARRLARHANVPLELEHLKRAFGDRELSAARRERIAVHEGSHILVDVMLHGPEGAYATMTSVGDRLAGAFRLQDADAPGTFGDHFRRLMVLLAGRVGETETYGAPSDGGGGSLGSDLHQATSEACAMAASFGLAGPPIFLGPASSTERLLSFPEVRTKVIGLLARAEDACAKMIAGNRGALDEIAARLVRDGRIEGKAVAAVLAAHGTHVPAGGIADSKTFTGKDVP
ncbi:AAA family ATPase [Bradyrhizobium sp. WYCCWR 12699]|uniref:AAA family ATPase n=1 Tax=Bradyrhizobium sp. WYCCWR 12699 TaxID=3064203 RepID=UPI0028A51068|nr:AAA family ATPase [Bradyrhizobium sp. WYCCWR 12699]MDT4738416.1 AAA family ATPase [Bradyrhizobium sp. WYCCWR 12699]